jgi:hypothetical protein
MDRLNYHTSSVSSLAPKSPDCVVEPFSKVDYYTSLQSTEIALNNLKKLNNKLDDNNIVTLAFLVNNRYLNDEDREKFKKEMHIKAMKEYQLYEIWKEKVYSKDNIDELRRNENSSTNITECDN